MSNWMVIGGVVVGVLVVIPLIVSTFLRDVAAGEIRLVSWIHGATVTYRGPGKSRKSRSSPRARPSPPR